MGTAIDHPKWWRDDQHGSAWERVKEAMRRDWEQTKNDVGARAPDLDQNVGDTVKQAAGAQNIPPANQKNPPDMKRMDKKRFDKFDDVEEPMSYGYAARMQYESQYPAWDDRLENQLKTEWSAGKHTGTWDDVRSFVRRGFEAPHNK